jgi:hypothetical protein
MEQRRRTILASFSNGSHTALLPLKEPRPAAEGTTGNPMGVGVSDKLVQASQLLVGCVEFDMENVTLQVEMEAITATIEGGDPRLAKFQRMLDLGLPKAAVSSPSSPLMCHPPSTDDAP